jgi:leader peptidase (prepilin peptidase)/N-methyltransferase
MLNLDVMNTSLFYLPASFILGLVAGSFISMLTYRLRFAIRTGSDVPFGSMINGRSKCPSCQKTIHWHQLIPVLSWLVQKGRCGQCGEDISVRYPVIELVTGLGSLVVAWRFGVTLEALYGIIFAWLLITMSIIDFEEQLLLDALTIPLLWIGLLVNIKGTFVPLESAVIGSVVGYLSLWTFFHTYKWLTKKEAFGYGDFKLLSALGAWAGLGALANIVLVAGISFLLYALLYNVTKNNKPSANQQMAFGPFLAFGGFCMLIATT